MSVFVLFTLAGEYDESFAFFIHRELFCGNVFRFGIREYQEREFGDSLSQEWG